MEKISMQKNDTMKNSKKMQVCEMGKVSASTLGGMYGQYTEAYQFPYAFNRSED